ncbi:MAG TPA: sugar ABC transporter permease [Chloroflexia bacterium]|nr:sugar ABC transporter permease [Chloroflexia bacterium]
MSLVAKKPAPTAEKARAKSRIYFLRKKSGPYLFLLPAILFLLVFLVYPVTSMVLFSFQEVNLRTLASGDTPFVGFDNYSKPLNDPNFLSSLVTSLIFTVGSIFFQYTIGFLLALLFNKKFPMVGLMKSLVMVAWMLPVVVSGTIFKWMLQSDSGVINFFLQSLGLTSQSIAWLTDPNVALWGTIIANIWIGIPFNMVLLLAGLQNISPSLYEAAVIDGANSMQKFSYLTFPLMRSTTLTVITLGFIYTLNVFDLVYVMTGGGPTNATEVLPIYTYRITFGQFDIGMGAAVACLMLLILLVVSGVYLALIRKEEAY